MDTYPFSAIFTKENKCGILFAFPKGSTLKGKNPPKGAHAFLYELTLTEKGGQRIFASSKSIYSAIRPGYPLSRMTTNN